MKPDDVFYHLYPPIADRKTRQARTGHDRIQIINRRVALFS